MSRRERRMKEMVSRVDNARIIGQYEQMTVFHTMLTKEQFVSIATELSEEYILFYKYDLATEKRTNPNTYHYLVILEERDNSPAFEYPPEFMRYVKS